MIINLLPQISTKTAERIIKEFAEKGQIEESDISKIQNLGYKPKISRQEGVDEYLKRS